MKYQFIEQHKQEFPVVAMCRVLDVSERGFYAWRKRPACQRSREDAQLTQEIQQVGDQAPGQIWFSTRLSRTQRWGAKDRSQTGSSAHA